MTPARRTLTVLLAGSLLAALLMLVPGGPAGAQGATVEPRPLVFVHGFAGSANQFESQAMRFTSNGYPLDHIHALEYDTTLGSEDAEDIWERLDVLIADIQADTGAETVDLLAHSMGTGLMQGYLNSDPDRADEVAHYVNLDGATGDAPPGGVPTLAVWGMGSPAREITGATNVYFSAKAHTEVVTAAETFVTIYEFFHGVGPASSQIVRAPEGEVSLSGRAQEFLTNFGVDDATLHIHEVDGTTGMRLDDTPEASFPLTGDGAWGPFAAQTGRWYEFAITREGSGTHHLYFEPFVRSSNLMRLLTSEPGAGVDALWEKSEDHANIVVLRNKEWWGDQPGASDSLTIAGTEVINAATAPQDKRAIALFAYDAGVDEDSDVSAPIPSFFGIPFLTAVDLFLAADTPPSGSVAVTETPRLGAGPVTVSVPNWAGITDRVTVQFNDFHTTAETFDDVAAGSEFELAIIWATESGLTMGFADGTFRPTRPVSRQVMAAFLHRLAGAPAGPFPDPGLSDVPAGHAFYDEIAWAVDADVVEGYPDGTFRPTRPVSRQVMAAFLHRLAGAPAGPFPDPGLSDVPAGHAFYDEIAWAADTGITVGFPDGTFRPTDPVSRQAMAGFLRRMSVAAPLPTTM